MICYGYLVSSHLASQLKPHPLQLEGQKTLRFHSFSIEMYLDIALHDYNIVAYFAWIRKVDVLSLHSICCTGPISHVKVKHCFRGQTGRQHHCWKSNARLEAGGNQMLD